MELPHLGENCIVCNRNDYLPFKCDHCDKTVCIDHKTNHGPDCPLNSTHFTITEDKNIRESLKQACDYCKKITLKLELVECDHCKAKHCLYHRHQAQHECQQLIESKEQHRKEVREKSDRQKEALERLKEITRPNSQQNPPQISAKPKQHLDPNKRALAKRVRLMRIKQSAHGPPNILQQDKIYFEIKFIHEPKAEISDSTKDEKSIKIFTTQKHTIGRMIDWSADELGIKNKNHLPGASQLVFKKRDELTDELNTLDSQAIFSLYLSNGQLDDGDELLLTYQL